MKKKYKSIIIEIFLIIAIMLAALSIFLKYVVLNKYTYLNILNECGTYGQITDSIYKKIDDILSSKKINIDIKESILTEDDIRREADNAVSGIVEYLKTGQNNVQPIDTSVYKQRIADILNSTIGNFTKSTSKDLTLNNGYKTKEVVFNGGKFQVDELNYIKVNSKSGQPSVKVEKLMSKEEAEARVREILKQKGLTEEQAIEKAKKKGITEEQALKILADYGITIDDEPKSNNSTVENSSAGDNSSVQKSNDNTTESSDGKKTSNSQSEDTIDQIPADKSIKSPLGDLVNKLQDEAGKNIEKEVEKINLNKVLESNKLHELANITSTIYKLFWVFMIIPIILIAILIRINKKDLNSSISIIRNAFLLSGMILFAVFYGIYLLKIYEKIGTPPVYDNLKVLAASEFT